VKLNKLQQAVAGIVLILLVGAITHFFILKGDYQLIRRTEENITKLKQDINVAKAIQKSAAELQDEMIHLKAQLDRLKKILPVTINQPKFLADLKRYANENGIEILSLINTKPIINDMIVEHPFGFKTRGNYHDFGYLFAQLTNYQRIINVKGLQLRRRPGAKDYSVEAWFVLSVFTYREPSEKELRAQIESKKKARKKASKKKKKRRK
jgi:Tfp pilus assembly protein PilO